MGRRERRMQERAEQREAAQMRTSAYAQAIVRREAIEKKARDRLSQNGITPEDLEKNYDLGYHKGFSDASEPVIKGCYAAVCLALHDLYGFGKERCKKTLEAIDQHMLMSLTSMDAIEEVWEKVGIWLDFKDAFDRIQEVQE